MQGSLHSDPQFGQAGDGPKRKLRWRQQALSPQERGPFRGAEPLPNCSGANREAASPRSEEFARGLAQSGQLRTAAVSPHCRGG